jgi:predicted secreted Zn-dependent protease
MRFCDLAHIEDLLNALDNGRGPTDQQVQKVRRIVNQEMHELEERSAMKNRDFERARARAVAEYRLFPLPPSPGSG